MIQRPDRRLLADLQRVSWTQEVRQVLDAELAELRSVENGLARWDEYEADEAKPPATRNGLGRPSTDRETLELTLTDINDTLMDLWCLRGDSHVRAPRAKAAHE